MAFGGGRLPFDFRDIEIMLLQHNSEISLRHVELYADSDIRIVKELFSKLDFISVVISNIVIQIQTSPSIDHNNKLNDIMQLVSNVNSNMNTDSCVYGGWLITHSSKTIIEYQYINIKLCIYVERIFYF